MRKLYPPTRVSSGQVVRRGANGPSGPLSIATGSESYVVPCIRGEKSRRVMNDERLGDCHCGPSSLPNERHKGMSRMRGIMRSMCLDGTYSPIVRLRTVDGYGESNVDKHDLANQWAS